METNENEKDHDVFVHLQENLANTSSGTCLKCFILAGLLLFAVYVLISLVSLFVLQLEYQILYMVQMILEIFLLLYTVMILLYVCKEVRKQAMIKNDMITIGNLHIFVLQQNHILLCMAVIFPLYATITHFSTITQAYRIISISLFLFYILFICVCACIRLIFEQSHLETHRSWQCMEFFAKLNWLLYSSVFCFSVYIQYTKQEIAIIAIECIEMTMMVILFYIDFKLMFYMHCNYTDYSYKAKKNIIISNNHDFMVGCCRTCRYVDVQKRVPVFNSLVSFVLVFVYLLADGISEELPQDCQTCPHHELCDYEIVYSDHGCRVTTYKYIYPYASACQHTQPEQIIQVGNSSTAACTIWIIGSGAIGVAVIMHVIAFWGYQISLRTQPSPNQSHKSNLYPFALSCNYFCLEQTNDVDTRAVITAKFVYFMIKPMLIAIAESQYNSYSGTTMHTMALLYQILMFVTATALACMTFNKHYKTITKLDQIMHNPNIFAKTYVASYLMSIIATYSICVFVCIFEEGTNDNINDMNWCAAIYPQCGWILFIKLYHNELVLLIKTANQLDKHNASNNHKLYLDLRLDTNIIYPQRKLKHYKTYLIRDILNHHKQLFLYQLSVLLASFFAIGFYLYFIVHGPAVSTSNKDGWEYVYYWQLTVAVLIAIFISVSMRMQCPNTK